MMKMVAVALALAVPTAQAATTYTLNGVEYVNAKEFAQENKLIFKNSAEGISFKSSKFLVIMYPFGKVGTLNGAKFTLTAPPQIQDGVVIVPISDLRKAFKIMEPRSTTVTAPTTTTTVTRTIVNVPTVPVREFSIIDSRKPSDFDKIYSIGPVFNFPLGGGKFDVDSAYWTCVNYITETLKSPSSAIFSQGKVVTYTDKAWNVFGVTDSQNGYGAMLRGDYYCLIQIRGDRLLIFSHFTTRK